MKKLFLISFIFFISAASQAQFIQNDVMTTAADLKLEHRFGAGIMFAGASGLLGATMDVNLNPFLSISAHLGTGHEYTSFGSKFQYYILGTVVHPYIGIGYANWGTGPGIRNLETLAPKLLYTDILNEDQKQEAFFKGFSVNMVYPFFGIQFIHQTQFGASTEVMYLFDISDMKGSPYVGVSTYYYF